GGGKGEYPAGGRAGALDPTGEYRLHAQFGAVGGIDGGKDGLVPHLGADLREVEELPRVLQPVQVRLQLHGPAVENPDCLEHPVTARGAQVVNAKLRLARILPMVSR